MRKSNFDGCAWISIQWRAYNEHLPGFPVPLDQPRTLDIMKAKLKEGFVHISLWRIAINCRMAWTSGVWCGGDWAWT